MRRRKIIQLVGAAGVASIAGCSGGSPETDADDDGTTDDDDGTTDDNDSLIKSEPNELLPSAELFSDGWDQHDDEPTGLHPVDLDGNSASTSFVTSDGEEGIDVEVTTFDSVDGAMSGYQEMRDYDFEGGDGEDLDIASEAHLIEVGSISVYFRDANVIGSIVHVTRGSSNSTEYAANWHETWRDS